MSPSHGLRAGSAMRQRRRSRVCFTGITDNRQAVTEPLDAPTAAKGKPTFRKQRSPISLVAATMAKRTQVRKATRLSACDPSRYFVAVRQSGRFRPQLLCLVPADGKVRNVLARVGWIDVALVKFNHIAHIHGVP